jgi:hypothetical protein
VPALRLQTQDNDNNPDNMRNLMTRKALTVVRTDDSLFRMYNPYFPALIYVPLDDDTCQAGLHAPGEVATTTNYGFIVVGLLSGLCQCASISFPNEMNRHFCCA